MNAVARKTLVVVDDDLTLHSTVSNFFTEKGYHVICFQSAAVAIRESVSDGQNWDIVLTDHHFTSMSDVDFDAQMRSRYPQLPTLPLTSRDDSVDGFGSALSGKYGECDFIATPLHLGKLKISVDRALKAKVPTPEELEVCNLVGRSPKFLAAMEIAKRVSKSMASILISGESGTGKEVIANFIHKNSKQSKGPFVAINCSAIPESLLESELFGHVKGSFTGALETRIGLFEAAENGTLFLDEIGDLNLPLQAKLLRVLQEKVIRRVGENQDREINCRIISATHQDLRLEIAEGRFREDLFFRLNVIPIIVPPLRERSEDLLFLAGEFLKKFALMNESVAHHFSEEAIHYLLAHRWQGNVRELENSVERAVLMGTGEEIQAQDFMSPLEPIQKVDARVVPQQAHDHDHDHDHENENENVFCTKHSEELPSLDEVICQYINYAVDKNNGARDKTAKLIGIDRKTLHRRMQPDESSV